MYASYFGFREEPFSLDPDPSFLYLGGQYRLAYSLLEYGISMRSGFIVITGDVGCGKTTLIRRLINDLNDRIALGLISHTHQRLTNLLEWVSLAFGLEYDAKSPTVLYGALVEFLASEQSSNRRAILVVDEAQNLDVAMLEEIRTLSNITSGRGQALQIILIGQPELKATLSRPELRQLLQRVATHYELKPLSEDQTLEYIHHRVAHAGGQPGLFSDQACHLIHRHSQGVPRLINILCKTSLVYAYAEDATHVGVEIVRAVLKDGAAGLCMEAPAASGLETKDATPSAGRGSICESSQPIREAGKIPASEGMPPKPDLHPFSVEDARQLFSRTKNRKT